MVFYSRLIYNYCIPFWATVKTIAPRCCGRPDALSPEAARPMAIVHQVVHNTEGAIVFTVAQKRFVIVALLPNPGVGGGGGAFCFFIVHRFLFNLTSSCSCIPKFNSRRVTFSIMQCLHTIFEKFGSSSIR